MSLGDPCDRACSSRDVTTELRFVVPPERDERLHGDRLSPAETPRLVRMGRVERPGDELQGRRLRRRD